MGQLRYVNLNRGKGTYTPNSLRDELEITKLP
jgi:hypothetical protein